MEKGRKFWSRPFWLFEMPSRHLSGDAEQAVGDVDVNLESFGYRRCLKSRDWTISPREFCRKKKKSQKREPWGLPMYQG